MKQLNVSKRLTGHIQLWVSVLLTILMVVFSFMPMFTIKTSEGGFVDKMTEMVEKVAPDLSEDIESVSEYDISAPRLIGSISMITKIIGAAKSGGDTTELDEYLKTEEGKEAVMTSMAIVVSIIGSFGDIIGDEVEDATETKEFNFFSIIFNVMISIVGLMFVLFLTLFMPIWAVIIAIIVLIKALKNMKTPENVSANVAARLTPMLSLPLTVMLFQCVVPGMTYASGIVGMCVIGIVSVALSFVVSRLRSYPSEEFKYLNVIQGGALIALVGFFVFFFSLIKTGIFKSFVNGDFGKYLQNVIIAKAGNSEIQTNNKYIVDAILMVVYLGLVLSCTKYLAQAARRFGCMGKKEKKRGVVGLVMPGKVKDNHLVNVIFMLPIYILPMILKGMKHYFEDVTSTASAGDASFLVLTAEQSSALTGVLIGLIIMLIAEIAVVVLKNVLCKNMSDERKIALLFGQTEGAAAPAPVAEVAAPVAEVAATETAAAEEVQEEAVEETVEETKDED